MNSLDRAQLYSEEELLKRMYRYITDEKQYLPHTLFAQECGCAYDLFMKVFKYHTARLQPWLQVRASQVLRKWENGDYAYMQHKSGKKYLKHLQTPRPRLAPAYQLVLRPEGIKLKVAKINKSDYGDREGLFDATA